MAEKSELEKRFKKRNELVTLGTLKEMSLRNELNKLKNEYQDTYKDVHIEMKEYKSQQKEFIKYLEDMLNDKKEYKSQQKEFIKYLEDEIYSIEPKGTGINYNCEYDSEEDYIKAMEEKSRLNTLQEILQKYKEIAGENKE